MKQSDAIHYLYRDLKTVTTSLVIPGYDLIFEEELQEYFPFNTAIVEWLTKLYGSEKYNQLDKEKLCLYLEKEHPFLFVRDLAHMNSWRLGFVRKDRRDHITGLMFSENPNMALEATLCLCRPTHITSEQSHWFDYKQAMTNLEQEVEGDWTIEAWKASAYCFLYFYLTAQGQPIQRAELMEVLEPYLPMIERGAREGSESLRQECGLITRLFRTDEPLSATDILFGAI